MRKQLDQLEDGIREEIVEEYSRRVHKHLYKMKFNVHQIKVKAVLKFEAILKWK